MLLILHDRHGVPCGVRRWPDAPDYWDEPELSPLPEVDEDGCIPITPGDELLLPTCVRRRFNRVGHVQGDPRTWVYEEERPAAITMIEFALTLASDAHRGQVDAAGEPYILHPLRVMTEARRHGMTEEEQAAAVLHDVLEDTQVPRKYIELRFGKTVLALVDALTRGKDERYDVYIARVIAAGLSARRIKRLDLQDNLGRLEPVARIDPKKAQRLYIKYRLGLGSLDKADKE